MHRTLMLQCDQTALLSSRRYSRRRFLQLSANMTVGLALSSCAQARSSLTSANTSAETSALPDRAEVQLVYQDWRTDWFPGMVSVHP
jgi:hypothetical protein